jgi:oxaloacetate decarboxylase gamma subunit
MTISEMLQQSVVLTILGMAVVFAFLWLMILCVNGVGKLIQKTGMDKDIRKSAAPKKPAGAAAEITSAISAAVTEYRKNEGRE